jgi:cytochrome P450
MDSPKQVTIPTVEQLKKVPLMDMVSKESMRMMTTVNTTERVCKSHHTFSNGLSVPKDTPIFVHMCGVHYNPSAFSNPFEFNPERFSDISSEESKNWLAFGLGNRTCKYMLLLLYSLLILYRPRVHFFTYGAKSNTSDAASKI